MALVDDYAAPMRVTVVIPARDAAAHLAAALDALAAQTLEEPWEVVVVDNGSRDGTATVAETHPLRPRVLRRGRGGGPGAARNDGVAIARGEVIAFTDSDCRPAPGWLTAGVAALKDADLVQGAVRTPAGARVGPFDHAVRIEAEYGLYETANLLVDRRWFERVGGFEDWLDTGDGRPFGEDAWLAWRLRRAGARTTFSAEALVEHEVFPGSWRDYLRERRRDGWFAMLAARVPELRSVFFWRRWFFSRLSAAFDLAAFGAGVAVARRAPAALLAAIPWLWLVSAESRGRTGVLSKRVAVVVALGDAIRGAALARRSLTARRPLL